MDVHLAQIGVLLLAAALVAMLTKRMGMPYGIGLVLAGFILALSPLKTNIALSKELIFSVLLPPLVFEAAFHIRWDDLKQDLTVVLTLATLGVGLAASATAAGMHVLAGWGWQASIVFGILISATDPVSVIATLKEAGVRGRLRLLLESESLLNDGTVAVAFTVALSMASGVQLSWPGVLGSVLSNAIGGLLCGVAVGLVLMLLAGYTEDHLVEVTLTMIAAYGAFSVAEHFGYSGVLATLAVGLVVGNVGRHRSISSKGREAIEGIWEYGAFLANSIVFVLLGVSEARQDFAGVGFAAALAIGMVTLGRGLAIYPVCLLFSRSRWAVDLHHQHVLFWGGLRGALALALALSLPAAIVQRREIVAVAFAVVAFSVFAQSATMSPLLRMLGSPAGPRRQP